MAINNAGVTLDENSLLWRYLGDRRFIMSICRAVTLQMLHPSIAAATHEFSLVKRRVFVHKQRTAPCIVRSAYDADFDEVRMIRYSHDEFHGHRPDGRRYHALNPDVFFFEHATYVDALFMCVDVFFGGLTEPMREQLYAETCEWYRRFGISSRVMPTTVVEFDEYFAHALATELDPDPGLAWYRDQLLRPTTGSSRSSPPQPFARSSIRWPPSIWASACRRAIGALCIATQPGCRRSTQWCRHATSGRMRCATE